ncbi:MAG: hypothetical protein ACREE0_15425, partial [Phenylobacterium sp.]
LYGSAAAALATLAVALSVPLAVTYFETGLVPRVPTAILCTGLILLAVLSGMCGLILDTVTRGRREIKRLAYLAMPAHEAGRTASVRALADARRQRSAAP